MMKEKNKNKSNFYSKLRKHLRSPGLRSIFRRKKNSNRNPSKNTAVADVASVTLPTKSSFMNPKDCKMYRRAGEKVSDLSDVFFQPTAVNTERLVKQTLTQSNILTASTVATKFDKVCHTSCCKKDICESSISLDAGEPELLGKLVTSNRESKIHPASDPGCGWKVDKMENVRTWLNSHPSSDQESNDDDSRLYLDRSSSSSRSTSPSLSENDKVEELNMSAENSPERGDRRTLPRYPSCEKHRLFKRSPQIKREEKEDVRVSTAPRSSRLPKSVSLLSERSGDNFDFDSSLTLPKSPALDECHDVSVKTLFRIRRDDGDKRRAYLSEIPILNLADDAADQAALSSLEQPVLPCYKHLSFSDSSDSDRELEARYSRWLHPNRSHMDRGDSSAQPSCSRWTDSQSPCVSMFAPPVFSSSGSSSCPAYKVPFRMHVDQA